MAVTEVIRFPFGVQPDRGSRFPADAFHTSALQSGSQPLLPELFFKSRPDGPAILFAAGGLCI
jgi:hypothetical protein